MATAFEMLGISPMGSVDGPGRGRQEGPGRPRTAAGSSCELLERDLRPSDDHHPRVARERDRLRGRDRRLDQRRPAPARRGAARRASRSTIDDFDRIAWQHAAARRPQARRPLRRHRPVPRRRRAAGRQAPARRRPAARRRAHGHRPHDRRGGGRRPRRPTARRSSAPLDDPLKPTGGLAILRGNLAPEGCVVKLAGHERLEHRGPARVFESEEDAFAAVKAQRDQGGRRRRHPQRGAGRRPRHARDARASPRRSWARGSATPSPCSPTAASRAPPTASWPATSPPRRRAAARSPPSATATRSSSTCRAASCDVELDDDEIARARRGLRAAARRATRTGVLAKYARHVGSRLRGRAHDLSAALGRPARAEPAPRRSRRSRRASSRSRLARRSPRSSARNSTRQSLNVCGRSSIGTWPVSSKTTLREPSISRSYSSASRDRHEHVLAPQTISVGQPISRQAVAEVVGRAIASSAA